MQNFRSNEKGIPPIQGYERNETPKGENIHLTVENIRIEDINIEKQVIRAMIDDEHIVELAMSMTRHGLLEPIVVEPKDGKYDLAAGLNRLIAAYRLKWDSIPASIRTPEPGVPIKAIALTENIMRRDLSFAEECEAIAHLHNNEHLSTNQITTMLGKSRAWVEKRLAAPNLPIEVREALFDAYISMGVAEEIAKIEDVGMRNEILNRAIYGKLSHKEVCVLKELYQDASNVYEAVEESIQRATESQAQKSPKRACEACGEPRDISQLKPIWICRDGCSEERLRSIYEPKNDEGGKDNDGNERTNGN